MKQILLTVLVLLSAIAPERLLAQDSAYKQPWKTVATNMPKAWYGSDESKTIAENVLLYQSKEGGWTKNTPMHHPLTTEQRAELTAAERPAKSVFSGGIRPTIDNGGTTTEMQFMAKMYAATNDERYRKSFERGLDYLLEAQYDNGGWAQFYPLRKGYYSHITYNDNAMVNVLRMLRDIFNQKPEYRFVASQEVVKKARTAFDKGIGCILKTQIMVGDQPTVWCAQHDEVTLLPAQARAYELPSFSGNESVGITLLLMELESTPAITRAIEGAVKWFEEHKIEGIRVERQNINGVQDRVVVQDASAPALWARFYDLQTGKPFFCDRDGVKRSSIDQIGYERRNGYSWYNGAAQKVLDKYYKSKR